MCKDINKVVWSEGDFSLTAHKKNVWPHVYLTTCRLISNLFCLAIRIASYLVIKFKYWVILFPIGVYYTAILTIYTLRTIQKYEIYKFVEEVISITINSQPKQKQFPSVGWHKHHTNTESAKREEEKYRRRNLRLSQRLLLASFKNRSLMRWSKEASGSLLQSLVASQEIRVASFIFARKSQEHRLYAMDKNHVRAKRYRMPHSLSLSLFSLRGWREWGAVADTPLLLWLLL